MMSMMKALKRLMRMILVCRRALLVVRGWHLNPRSHLVWCHQGGAMVRRAAALVDVSLLRARRWATFATSLSLM